MELTEATALARTFITRLVFKLHSLPLDARKGRAMAWWKRSGSTLPVRAALDEARAHLTRFSVRNEIDRERKRTLHLSISALAVHAEGGNCPALADGACRIYEDRPLTCRTTPFHYSRPVSTLPSYLTRFVATPGYLCDTSAAAPVVLDEGKLAHPLARVREDAAARAAHEKTWKEVIAAQLGARGFPSYADIVANSDRGGATTLPMSMAWKIAAEHGLIEQKHWSALCRDQLRLLRVETASNTRSSVLLAMREEYETLCSDAEPPDQLAAASCLA